MVDSAVTRTHVAALALLVLGCASAGAQSSPGFGWPQHPRLTWDDFKGRAPESASYPSAVSDTGFKYQLVCRNGLLDIDVAAFFSPSGSWVKPDAKTPELLRHEQGHFDMAEMYALRLRKSVLDAKIGCGDTARANAAGEKMVSEFQKQWQDAEREYEEDTRFGSDLKKQDAASERIAAGLAAMSAYEH
jgi:hypothetical protein